MTKRITIAVKEPGQAWRIVQVEDSLPVLQKIVGGYIEGYTTDERGISYFCNDEGKLQHLEPNIPFGSDIICGPVFAVRSDEEGAFVSLTAWDQAWFLKEA